MFSFICIKYMYVFYNIYLYIYLFILVSVLFIMFFIFYEIWPFIQNIFILRFTFSFCVDVPRRGCLL